MGIRRATQSLLGGQRKRARHPALLDVNAIKSNLAAFKMNNVAKEGTQTEESLPRFTETTDRMIDRIANAKTSWQKQRQMMIASLSQRGSAADVSGNDAAI